MCIIEDISKLYGISLLLKANKGQHIGKQGVEYYNKKHRIKIVSVESLDNRLFDLHLSGEYENAEKIVFNIIPKALNIIYNPC